MGLQRIDMSDWIIHFVHGRHPEDDMYVMAENIKFNAELEGIEVSSAMVHYFDENGIPKDMSDISRDEEFAIEEDAEAFSVLKKIVHDGFIRSGWSFRDGKPTIYGPFSAVCFTEMPLYALMEYAKTRGQISDYVGNYGIAFKKKELFAAGARPVIYGLSGVHKEIEDSSDEWCKYGMRVLHKSCGIGLNEQYRYVYTNLDREVPVDWTHEREWRWPLRDSKTGIPGLAFLLSEEWGLQFTEILIIVNTIAEQEELLLQIKNQYDSQSLNCGISYNMCLLPALRVVSIEKLSTLSCNTRSVRVDDIPTMQMQKMPIINVSDDIKDLIKKIVPLAKQWGAQAISKFIKEHPDYKTPPFRYGFAYAATNEVSAITQAMLDESIAHTYSDGKYIIYLGGDEWPSEDEDLLNIGAHATAEYLSRELGQYFYAFTRPD